MSGNDCKIMERQHKPDEVWQVVSQIMYVGHSVIR